MPKNIFRRITKTFFIFSNCIVAVLFLLACYGGWFNPKYFWPVGLLTLGAVYLLAVLLLFIIFWLFVKARWSLISVVTILVAYQPVTNIVPLRFAYLFSTEKPANAIRVMSWNVEHFDILEHKSHPEKKQDMLNLIKEYQPDVAVYQEMVGSELNSKAINYIPEIMDQVGFTDYNYSYNPKLDFDGQHHFGIITFSKYPIINKQTISAYPNDYNSIFQFTDIVKGADTFRVFNVHLQSLKFTPTNLQYLQKPGITDESDLKKSKSLISKLKKGFLKRQLQADRIRVEIDKSPYPVMVCGDFNDVPNSYAYNTIGKGLQNTFTAKGSGFGRTFSGISATLRIDNIFAAKNFEVKQFARVKKKLSDHFPVIADVAVIK